MHRSPGSLVLSRNREKPQSGYEPELRKELVSYELETALVKDTALGNTVADVTDSDKLTLS